MNDIEISAPALTFTQIEVTSHPQLVEAVGKWLSEMGTGNFIAGSAARELHTGVPGNDIDVFSIGMTQFQQLRNHLEAYPMLYFFVGETRTAVTFLVCSDDHLENSNIPEHFKGRKLQLIKPVTLWQGKRVLFGGWEEVLTQFDFYINMFAILPDGRMMAAVAGLSDVNDGLARVANVYHPLEIFYRMAKVYSKGFAIAAADVVKMFEKYNNLEEIEREILHDLTVPTNSSFSIFDALTEYVGGQGE